VAEIEAELSQLEGSRAEIERKIEAAQTELDAARDGEQSPGSDDFVTEQIKQFNRARASAPNPLRRGAKSDGQS
jgi:hypothetical protein